MTFTTDEQIKCLQNLISLNINNCENMTGDCLFNFTKLKKLEAKSVNINLEQLNSLQNLEYLNLSYTLEFLNFDFKLFTKNLKVLKLKEANIYNCQYLENFNNLIELNLNDAIFDDITKLKLPKSLQKLSLASSDIIDEQLQNLENLKYLCIHYCSKLKGNFLQNIKNLEKLLAGNTEITDKELSYCNGNTLQYLDIDGSDLIEGNSLLKFKNLKYLFKLESTKLIYSLFFCLK